MLRYVPQYKMLMQLLTIKASRKLPLVTKYGCSILLCFWATVIFMTFIILMTRQLNDLIEFTVLGRIGICVTICLMLISAFIWTVTFSNVFLEWVIQIVKSTNAERNGFNNELLT